MLIALMVASLYVPTPSGPHIGFWGFVGLWLREILLLGLLLFALLAVAATRLRRFIRNRAKQGEDAP